MGAKNHSTGAARVTRLDACVLAIAQRGGVLVRGLPLLEKMIRAWAAGGQPGFIG